MMKTYLYLSSAIVGVMIGGNTWAQCVSTQDCTALGYTETSCPNGGVKCPFGNKWICINSGITPEQCTELGFTQTCTGTNQTGGAGKACNGKYNICKCAANLTWNTDTKSCEANTANCVIGALYYSDGTCSQDKLSSKTLLGVVIYEKSANQNGWIMTVKPVKTGIAWGVYGTTTGITDKAVSASCTNTQKLVAKGSRFAAANAANNYKPTGTPSGKSWCLPSHDLLNNLNNSVNFAKVNAGITTAGGTKLGYGGQPSYSYEYVRSSSESSDDYAWGFGADTSGSFNMRNLYKYGSDSYYSVRPVLAFQILNRGTMRTQFVPLPLSANS